MNFAAEQAIRDIGALLETVHRAGEWQDEHDDMLQRWRDARGPDHLGGWTWWAKGLDDETYVAEGPTKADAVADLLNDNPDVGAVQVCEARSYDDEFTTLIGESDGTIWFAEERRKELLPPAKALELARTSARHRPRRAGSR